MGTADLFDGETPAPRTPVRRRRRYLTLLLGVASVGLLIWVAPPARVVEGLGDLNPLWVLGAVALELGSCVSYVIVFRRFFPETDRVTSRRVAWISMAAGAVLPGGNFSSAAAGGLLLRRSGLGKRVLLERCAALLCLLTAFGFVVNGIFGALLLAGVPGGPHDLRHSGIPILVTVAVLGGAVLLVALRRHLGARAPRLLRGASAGLAGAWRAAGQPHWRLLGVAGFLCLDLSALWAACAATGHPLGFPAVALAYFIGYLATMLPMPGGLGVLDAGLAGSLVLYGLAPPAAVGAVLVYHFVAIWVPGFGGLVAWLATFRRPRRLRERSSSVVYRRPRTSTMAGGPC